MQISTFLFAGTLLLATGLFAQQSIPAAGGNAIGFGGSVSYSVGQTFYHVQSDTSGEVRQGVQQPYEIYTVSINDETSIAISLSIYPNPTSDILTLDIKENIPLQYKYLLFDAQGKLIDSNPISDKQTQLSFGVLPPGVYMLNIVNDKRVVKVFKIVKN